MTGPSPLENFLIFTVQIIFGLVIFAVLMRLILQLVRADFRNPVGSFFMSFTNPMIMPLRRFIPGLFGIDMASVVLLILLQVLELVLITLILGYHFEAPLAFILGVLGMLIQHTVMIYGICVFFIIMVSWINPSAYQHPVGNMIYQITEPLMSRARRLLPPINNVDLSPILIMIALGAIYFLIAAPMIDA